MGAIIKNNLKLMLRSKWILIFMTILPVVVIGMLSNIFSNMPNKDYDVKNIKAGYVVNEDNDLYKGIKGLSDICKDNNIKLSEYKDCDYKKLINDGVIDVFVKIDNKNYFIYESSKKEKEALVMESMLSSYFYNTNEANIVMSNIDNNTNIPISNDIQYVKIKSVKADPMPSAIDYYGIIEIVFFTWCGVVSLAAVISSERKNNIVKRLYVSSMPKYKLYLGKLIPCFLAIIFEILIALILSVVIYNVHWGNLIASFGILVLLAITASASGMVLFYVFKNVAASIVTGVILIYIIGFLGGSFQTYMLSNIPDKIAKLSPQYYVNRTLVEFSTKGYSAYTGKCVIYLSAILLVSVVLGLILMN